MTEIFMPLLVSLILLMPVHPWRTGAMIAGGLGLLVIISDVATHSRQCGRADRFDRRLQVVSGGLVFSAV